MKKLFLAIALVAAPVIAAKKVNPADWLVIAGRDPANVKLDEFRRPTEVLAFLGIKQGDVALDYGAGTGYYSEIMARAVGPKGKVFAWTPQQFVSNDRAKAAWADVIKRSPNVKQVIQPFDGFSAAPKSYSFALLHLTYHDLYWESASFGVPKSDPDVFLAALFKAMKPGAIIGVIDHRGAKGNTREIVEKTHRIDPDVVKADFAKAGFKFVGEANTLQMRGDDYSKTVFDRSLRNRTDRFVLKFKR